MISNKAVLFFVLLLPLTFARCSDKHRSVTHFIGGQHASARSFPSTVFLPAAFCGAGKIGPTSFITAAHCLADNARNFEPGTQVVLQYGLEREQSVEVTVDEIVIHPSYDTTEDVSSVSDVAILNIREKTPFVKIAKLDTTPLARGQKVVISGYGCIWDGRGSPPPPERLGLKYARTSINRLDDYYFTTPRNDHSGKEGRICQGDSGTPVYIDQGSPWTTIIGVTSFRRLKREPIIWSAFARLDRASKTW